MDNFIGTKKSFEDSNDECEDAQYTGCIRVISKSKTGK